MIAVIFEVEPAAGKGDAYLGTAQMLMEHLTAVDGFISIERSQSLSDSRKLLSLSFWRDEAAVAAWRNDIRHRAAQEAGREQIFADYRLRVAEVVRDYGMNDRAQVPEEARAT